MLTIKKQISKVIPKLNRGWKLRGESEIEMRVEGMIQGGVQLERTEEPSVA